MSNKLILSAAALLAGLALAPVAEAQVVGCIYASQNYSIGTTACFRKVRLECRDHNYWVQKGGCDSAGVPDGEKAAGLPGSFDGALCAAGGFYSPDAEGCIAGFYQQCRDGGQWVERSPVDDGAKC